MALTSFRPAAAPPGAVPEIDPSGAAIPLALVFMILLLVSDRRRQPKLVKVAVSSEHHQ